MTDRALAKKLGLSVCLVYASRRKFGIPSFKSKPPETWTKKALSLLGTDRDCEVAKKIGLTKQSIYLMRKKLGIPSFRRGWWTKERNALLGKESDSILGKKWCINYKAVKYQRIKLGIAQFRLRHRWTAAELKLLDSMSDADVARKVGVTELAVRSLRSRRRVPMFK